MSDTIQKTSFTTHYPDTAITPLGSARDDEIDLITLFLTLWNQKQLIAVITFISTLLASIYAFMAPEQWTVKAYLSAPRIVEISDYLTMHRTLSLVKKTEANPQKLSDDLFKEFTFMAASPNEKIQYLSGTPDFINQTQGMNEKEKQQLLNEMTEKKMVLTHPDEKRKQPYFIFSVTTHTPEQSKILLENYIQTINEKVIHQVTGEFHNRLTSIIQSLKKEKLDIDFNVQTMRKNQLTMLEQSLNTAKEAGIKDYYTNSAGQGNTKIELANSVHQYMLGENYLRAEIQSHINSPLVYPVRYHEIERELAMLEPLLQQQATAQAYRYQLSPDKYVKKDQPRRALILILGFIIGLIISISWVLISSQLKQNVKPNSSI